MSSTRRRAGIIAAWALAATVTFGAVAGAVGSVALAEPSPTPSGSSSGAPSAERSAGPGAKADGERRGRRHGHGLLRRALHGEHTVKGPDGTFVTLLTQRGEVTAVDADSVTLKSEDGYTREYAVTAETTVRKGREPAKVTDLAVGDRAAVVAVKDGDTATARRLVAGTPR